MLLRFRLVILSALWMLFAIAGLAQPTLLSISPTAIAPGTQLTLTGSGFGTSPGAVFFSWGSSVEVSSFSTWNDNTIVLTVPSDIVPGTVSVDVNGVYSNTISYTTIPPTLTSISATAIAPGMQLTLTGSGFGTSPNAVFFSWGSSVEVTSFSTWNDNTIVLTVPNGILTGTVSVSQNGVSSNSV